MFKDRGDTRLLQHDLREPDAVGVLGAAPGQVAAICGEPAQQALPEFSRTSRGDFLYSHGAILTDESGTASTPRGTILSRERRDGGSFAQVDSAVLDEG